MTAIVTGGDVPLELWYDEPACRFYVDSMLRDRAGVTAAERGMTVPALRPPLEQGHAFMRQIGQYPDAVAVECAESEAEFVKLRAVWRAE